MEMPVVQAVNLIKSKNYKWLDSIYQGSIPTETADDDTKTVVLVTEYLSEPTYYGNAQFKGWLIGVEVQIFYKKNPDENFLKSEIELASLFKKNKWQVEQSKNHIKDPDTKQLSKVFYFSKKEILKEAN